MRSLARVILTAMLAFAALALFDSVPSSVALVSAAPSDAARPSTRVELVAAHGNTERAEQFVTSLGGEVELASGDRVQALVDDSALAVLEASRDIVEVARPGVFVPLQVVSAVDLIGADDWQDAGFSGHGVKVAVLDAGFSGYQSRLGTSLPDEVVTRSFRSDGQIGGSTEHGRRAAEVVHSVAPGAELYLVNFSTVTELSAAVDYLVDEDVQIVSFSLGYIHNGPGDGTGPVNSVVSRGVNAGQSWAVASGNWAQQHWSGVFTDTDEDTVNEFAPGVEVNRHTFSSGDLITVSVRWDEPWGQACSDYDIELFGPTGALVRAARGVQNCDDDPVESLQVLATQTGEYSLRVVQAHAADGPRTLDVMMVGTPDRGNPLSSFVPQSSLSEPADNPGVITVGALTISSSRTEASYSSRGPTEDGRFKPNLLAPTGAGNSSPAASFGGTSAAAPHVAGALALLQEAFPTANSDRLASLLQTRARGVPSTPNGSGARRLDMGSLFGLGPVLPPGAASAEYLGELPPAQGVTIGAYSGPDGYPARFVHLLIDDRVVQSLFGRLAETGRWRRYIPGAPDFVNAEFDTFEDGQQLLMFIAAP